MEVNNSNEPFTGKYLDKCEQDERAGFVTKVYALICCMLSVTIIFTAICMNSTAILDFMSSTTGTVLLCTFGVIYIIFIFVGFCCWPLLRRASFGYSVLGILTVCLTYLVAYICIFI